MIISSPFSVRKTDRRIKYFMAWQLIYPTRCLWYLVKYDILIVSAFHTIGHLHAIWIAQVQDLARVSLFPADDFGHPAHLHDTECGPKFIEPVVHSLNFISRTAPVIAEGSHVPLEIGIGCDRDAAFSGRDGLRRIEREDAGIPECARLHAVPLGSDRMGAILYERDLIAPAIFGDTVTIECARSEERRDGKECGRQCRSRVE